MLGRRTRGREARGNGRGKVGLLRQASWLLMAAAFAPAVYAQTQTFSFAIERQPLSSALLALGRQADISILAPTALVAGKMSPDVRGQLSAAQALDQLLEGSGLTYTFVESNAVKIIAREPATTPASEKNASQQAGEGDRVEVTGTYLRGAPPASAPVEVYTRDDIARSGAATTEQFVGKLPQNLGTLSQYGVGASTAGPNLDAVTAVDLRGLGAGTTLTLLNGHRMALSNAGRSGDVSFIPASAIERVEVLTDGASAIYGSDAVGGVINFILRSDYEGAETRLSAGGVSEGGMRQADASQTFGARWTGGHGLLAYGYHTASALRTSERSYASAAGPGNLTPVDTRHNVFASGSQALSDRLTLDLDAGAGWRKVKNSYSNLNSPVLAAQTFTRYESQSDQAFADAALDYAINDDFNARLTVSWSAIDTDSTASLVRFNLVPPVTASQDFSSRNAQLDIAGKLDGVLMALPAGDLRFSIGGGVLEEDYQGVNPSSNRQSLGTLARRSTYAFAEVLAPLVGPDQNIPFVHRLSLNLAARYTDYQDTSEPALNRDFGDSTDPKIGLLWSPVDALNLRATYGSSFRAPSLTQLDPAGGAHYLLATNVGGAAAIVFGMAGYAMSDLGPETADTYTLGFDYKNPDAPDFRFSATYYNIDYTNRIGVAPTGGLNPFASPALLPDLIYHPPSAAFIEEALTATPLLLNTSGVNLSDPQTAAAALFARNDVWMYDVRFRNLALSRQDGIDVSASQRFDVGWGDLALGANLTHILNYRQQGSAASAVLDAVDSPGQPPDWKGRVFASLSNEAFSGTLNVNYTDDYRNQAAPVGQQAVDSWTTLDLNLSYQLGDIGAVSGPRLSLSIQNLMNEDPPFLRPGSGSSIIYPVGFDPANANPLGRFIVLGLVQRW